MHPVVRRTRLAVFFAGIGPILALFGLLLAPIRVVALLSPALGRRLVRPAGRLWGRMLIGWACLTLRCRIEVEGERAPRAGAVVVVSNHQSIIDIALLCSILPRYPSFVSKESLRRYIPNISPAGRIAGCAWISRKKGDVKQFEELRALGRRIESDRATALIYPEGTRSRDGRLGEFRAGGLAAILEGAPSARLLPVALDGTFRAATWASLLADLPGLRVRVRIGAPIEVPAGADREAAVREACATCRRFCEATLADWRGAATPDERPVSVGKE